MTFWQFMRGIELRDARSARIRAWMRLCHASIGGMIGGFLYYLFHPHSSIDGKVLIMGVVLIVSAAGTGAAYDFWRVRHPEKTDRFAWLHQTVFVLIGASVGTFLLLWLVFT
jgi:hypothetical protein